MIAAFATVYSQAGRDPRAAHPQIPDSLRGRAGAAEQNLRCSRETSIARLGAGRKRRGRDLSPLNVSVSHYRLIP